MTTRVLWVGISALLFAGCAEAVLGEPCNNEGCGGGLYCGFDETTAVHGVCTSNCATDAECVERHGEDAECIDDGYCARACDDDDDCPEDATCGAGHCAREP